MNFLLLISTVITVLQISLSNGQSQNCPKIPQPPTKLCPDQNKINPKYRPIDGKLNNRCQNLGESFKTYDRLRPAHYDDCVWSFRRAISGADLPLPRNIINGVLRPLKRPALRAVPNLLSAMFGQYIGHDIGAKLSSRGIIPCCTEDNSAALPVDQQDKSCMPILIPKNDPDFGAKFPDFGCMATGIVRSTNSTAENLKTPVDQLNRVTAFLDNSNLYGSTEEVMNSLRSFQGGRMITNSDNILPERDGVYFLGDNRLGQTPQLAIWHSIYLREHNRIAGILGNLNPHWDDTKIFEETRRINIAQYQHVVYSEWLPRFLNPETMIQIINPSGVNFQETSTFNELNSAVFRMFHTFLPKEIQLIAQDGSVRMEPFSQQLLNTLTKDNYEEIARGLLQQPMNTGEFSHMFHGLFVPEGTTPGRDLISTDLNRGRDHGLPPYVKVLQYFCKPMEAIKDSVINFDSLKRFFNAENLNRLKLNYKSVLDVDLLAGALLETPLKETMFGPTAQKMFARQFVRLKLTDPYFYTKRLSPYPFSPGQLQQIRKATSNHLFCLNSGVSAVPKEPSIAGGDLVNCSSLQAISYQSWKE